MTTSISPQPSRSIAPATAVPRGTLGTLYRLFRLADVPGELVLPDGRVLPTSDGECEFRVRLRRTDAFARGLDERAIAEAYVDGEFDIEGDMLRAFDIRARLVDRVPLGQFFRIWLGHFFRRRTTVNRRAIDFHYSLGDDFYLSFLDTRYRIYTHGIYHRDDETLEEAMEHKMEQAFRALGLRPGMRLLDIGAGWGASEQYFGSRGIHVTGLTIGDDSRRFVEDLIHRERLTAEVKLEDFLVHRPAEPYDAIVILGVIEHIPDYRRFAARVWECLKPGGLIYLDASASREKYSVGSFAREYIWTGTHTYLVLQDLVREFLYHGIDVLEVQNETRHYGLTCADWSLRFDAVRERIVSRWGERLWRAWRLYLWGGAHAFLTNDLQAYHVLGRRGDDPGPRPSLARRAVNGLKSIV
jgi:cyclopropane-fatty-acyl-phospholipid synthase